MSFYKMPTISSRAFIPISFTSGIWIFSPVYNVGYKITILYSHTEISSNKLKKCNSNDFSDVANEKRISIDTEKLTEKIQCKVT